MRCRKGVGDRSKGLAVGPATQRGGGGAGDRSEVAQRSRPPPPQEQDEPRIVVGPFGPRLRTTGSESNRISYQCLYGVEVSLGQAVSEPGTLSAPMT